MGRAVMGRKAGDRVYVDMGSGKGYYLQIRAIEKGTDNGDIPIGSFLNVPPISHGKANGALK